MTLTVNISGSAAVEEEDNNNKFLMYPKQVDQTGTERNNLMQFSSSISESQLPPHPKGGWASAHDRDSEHFKSCNPTHNMIQSMSSVQDPIPLKHIQPIGHRDGQPRSFLTDQRVDNSKDLKFAEGGQLVTSKPIRGFTLDVEDLDIPWSDLVLKARIGAGICFYQLLEETFGVKTCTH